MCLPCGDARDLEARLVECGALEEAHTTITKATCEQPDSLTTRDGMAASVGFALGSTLAFVLAMLL